MGESPRDLPRPPEPISPEFADGWDAWKQGVPREACPYLRDEDTRAWLMGWDTAENEMGKTS